MDGRKKYGNPPAPLMNDEYGICAEAIAYHACRDIKEFWNFWFKRSKTVEYPIGIHVPFFCLICVSSVRAGAVGNFPVSDYRIQYPHEGI
jgi:hypothetical protein